MSRNILGGSPFVVGSRVPVRRLWAFYRAGATVEQLLRRFPQLSQAKVFDALAFALDNEEVVTADLEREEQMLARVSRRRPARPKGNEQMALPFASSEEPAAAPRRRR